MEFIDEVVIQVRSGKGGNGSISFRREKWVPRGGPDGGDGGNGGFVIFEATSRRNTLVDYRRQRHWFADDGIPGQGKQMHGSNAKPLLCPVPIGTLIIDEETGENLADLDHDGARWEVAGGSGGHGNIHFKTSSNRTPRIANPGHPGTELRLRLELKLLADVGLLGFPNAGKSTFLGRVSAATPRVADYPFTTLVPQLGVVRLDDEQTFLIADIPGLIEGAAEGAGLGHRFLKHVERCGLYLHLVSPDAWDDDPVTKLDALNGELKRYGSDLARRPQVVALTKIDTLSADEIATQVAALEAATGAKVFPVSSVSGAGLPQLIGALWTVLDAQRSHEVVEE